MKRTELVAFLDEYLHLKDIADDSLNGLQVDGREEVTSIATAVDVSTSSIRAAAETGAQLLLVHHGLFWARTVALVGPQYERIRLLVDNRVGLYAVHLPLDMHPEVGNNALLANLLDLRKLVPFGRYHETVIGLSGFLPEKQILPDLCTKLTEALGAKVQCLDFGVKEIESVALVSGGGGSILGQGMGRFDLLVTGETDHVTYRLAEDSKQSLIFATHYATETLGIRALGELLSERFGLQHTFLSLPSPY
jgi:dinuclear metal center YbgI/SA1388 family protein